MACASSSFIVIVSSTVWARVVARQDTLWRELTTDHKVAIEIRLAPNSTHEGRALRLLLPLPLQLLLLLLLLLLLPPPPVATLAAPR